MTIGGFALAIYAATAAERLLATFDFGLSPDLSMAVCLAWISSRQRASDFLVVAFAGLWSDAASAMCLGTGAAATLVAAGAVRAAQPWWNEEGWLTRAMVLSLATFFGCGLAALGDGWSLRAIEINGSHFASAWLVAVQSALVPLAWGAVARVRRRDKRMSWA